MINIVLGASKSLEHRLPFTSPHILRTAIWGVSVQVSKGETKNSYRLNKQTNKQSKTKIMLQVVLPMWFQVIYRDIAIKSDTYISGIEEQAPI